MPVGMPPRAAQLPLFMVEGNWAEARDLAEVTRSGGSPLERQMAVMTLGILARYTGDVEIAWRMVRELLPRGPDSEPEDGLFPYAIETLRLAARLALDEKRIREVGEWLSAHDRWIEWSGAVRGQAESDVLRALLSLVVGDLNAARARAGAALEKASDPRQPLVQLECYEVLGQIAWNAGELDEAEEHFNQALALADACEAPYLRARVLLRLSDVEQARGRVDAHRKLLDEVRTGAQQLDARPLLTAVRHREEVAAEEESLADLTAREMDVLRLVAQGMTDAEVASHLYISPRTVGQHLRSVYSKLGVSSRAAATRLAVEADLL